MDTVRAAIEATVELLDREPEQQVTIEAIRHRSGVSQGSLTHHFGSRDGLIAAAHVERYVRMCAADRAFLAPFDGALEDPHAFVTTILGMVEEMLSEHRHEVRWVRLTAIAAAFGDEQLTRTLSESYTALTTRLTGIVEAAHRSGILPPDVDARTVALLLTMHAQGLVLDDLADVEVAAMVGAESDRRGGDLWRAEVLGETGRVPSAVAARLSDLRAAAGGAATADDGSDVRPLIEAAVGSGRRNRRRPTPGGSNTFEDVLRAAISRLRSAGESGVVVQELRREFGLSPQGFHRLFGTRDALVREARVRLEISRAAGSVARFGQLVASSGTPADMRRAVAGDAIRMADDVARSAMWQRIETIAAARTDTELRVALGRVQRAARDLLIEQVCLAQQRGIMDPSLTAAGHTTAPAPRVAIIFSVRATLRLTRPGRRPPPEEPPCPPSRRPTRCCSSPRSC